METRFKKTVFPWYKERLQTKYLKPTTIRLPSLTWHKGIDDVSPAPSQTQRDISPVIFTINLNHNDNSTSTKVPKQPVSKKHACFSKQMIQKQKRREYVAAVEDQLTKNPLALYPHYKEYMPAEIFDKVLSVLYTDMSASNSISKNVTSLSHVSAEENVVNSSNPNRDKCLIK